MTQRLVQTFGRRGTQGRPPPRSGADFAAVAPPLPADLVAAIVRPTQEQPTPIAAGRPLRVARSLRAALVAGLCAGFFHAAFDVAAVPAEGKALLPFIGAAALPLPAISLIIGLWSAARTTALVLLVTHRLLDRLGSTGSAAYALGGGLAAFAYAAAVDFLVPGLAHANLGLELLCGAGAGFLYRRLAGTLDNDAHGPGSDAGGERFPKKQG